MFRNQGNLVCKRLEELGLFLSGKEKAEGCLQSSYR